jgi:hypothetical protein
MELRTPGRGEIVAAIGAVLMLFGLIGLPWYDVGEPKIAPLRIDVGPPSSLLVQVDSSQQPDEPQELPITRGALPESFGAWEHEDGLDTIANLVILVAGLAGLIAAAAAAVGSRLDATGTPLALLSALALLAVVMRMVNRPEELDEDVLGVPFEFEAGLEIGIWIALIGALVQLAGALMRLGRGPEPAPTTPSPARGSPS